MNFWGSSSTAERRSTKAGRNPADIRAVATFDSSSAPPDTHGAGEGYCQATQATASVPYGCGTFSSSPVPGHSAGAASGSAVAEAAPLIEFHIQISAKEARRILRDCPDKLRAAGRDLDELRAALAEVDASGKTDGGSPKLRSNQSVPVSNPAGSVSQFMSLMASTANPLSKGSVESDNSTGLNCGVMGAAISNPSLPTNAGNALLTPVDSRPLQSPASQHEHSGVGAVMVVPSMAAFAGASATVHRAGAPATFLPAVSVPTDCRSVLVVAPRHARLARERHCGTVALNTRATLSRRQVTFNPL